LLQAGGQLLPWGKDTTTVDRIPIIFRYASAWQKTRSDAVTKQQPFQSAKFLNKRFDDYMDIIAYQDVSRW